MILQNNHNTSIRLCKQHYNTENKLFWINDHHISIQLHMQAIRKTVIEWMILHKQSSHLNQSSTEFLWIHDIYSSKTDAYEGLDELSYLWLTKQDTLTQSRSKVGTSSEE